MRGLLVLGLAACSNHGPGTAADPPDARADSGGSVDVQPDARLALAFAPAVSYPSEFKPYVIATADLDGDGALDIVVANEASSTIALYRNDGTGTFAPLPWPTPDGVPTGEYPTGAVIADLDRDGIPDVATANYHGNSVSVLRGSRAGGSYALGAHVDLATVAGSETSNLAVGDVTGDGILDILATDPLAASASVFLGRGDGTFVHAPDLAIAIPQPGAPCEPYAVAIGDFDRDGMADAAFADNRHGSVIVELGHGDGTFRRGAVIQIPAVGSYALIATDLDRDGLLDLVVAGRSSDELDVLLGRGDGTFRDPVAAATGPGTGPYSLAVADFDRDGIPDIITANFMTGNASVLLGNGDGTLAAPLFTGPTGAYTYSVAVGDFDGDGKPDFAAANAGANTFAVERNVAR